MGRLAIFLIASPQNINPAPCQAQEKGKLPDVSHRRLQQGAPSLSLRFAPHGTGVLPCQGETV